MKIYVCCQGCLTRIALPARDGHWCCPKCGLDVHIRGVEFQGQRGHLVETEIDVTEVAFTLWGRVTIGEALA